MWMKLLLVFAILPALTSAEPVRTPYVTAELVAEQELFTTEGPQWMGLRLQMIPHWHTYWRFPGDSGLPTKVDWTLPKGWKIGGPFWPLPSAIPVPPLVNFGFEGEALIGFLLDIPPGTPSGTYPIKAKASWLVCKEECIPEKVDLSLYVRVADADGRPSAHAAKFARLREEQPRPLPEDWTVRLSETDTEFTLHWEGKNPIQGKGTRFFPYEAQLVDARAVPVSAATADGFTTKLKKASPFSLTAISLSGIFVLGGKGSERIAYEVNLPRAAAAVAPGATSAPGIAQQAAPVESPELFLTLAFAFLGGIILNLMPCVFPVLGIKVMSLVKQGAGDAWHARIHAKVYTLGILVSFWLLTALLLVLRGAGQAVGWGFQLQEPGFVVILIFLFAWITANLAGFVELMGSWTGAGSRLAGRDGYSGSFFTGVLAVLVATPCTAPFMGTAIGVALAQPAWSVVLVFTALALGLASPFLVLAYQPALLRRLPRPGPWMERMKEVLAFPMAATVLWLLWVLGKQVGMDGMLQVQGALLLFFGALWAFRRAGPFSWILGGLLLVASFGLGAQAARERVEGSVSASADWEPYSAARLTAALDAGEAVFVDFTAAWCLTCQVNKRVVLERERMQDFFRGKGVKLIRADWTNQDPEITRALERHGRAGVPLYLAYPAGAREPKILPQLLTESIVREAFP
jgi:thiol:disulfide interchange protein DsbD